MAFTKKEWENRVSENPSRRKLINVSTLDETIVDVVRYEGQITSNGDTFSAENMNDLEDRIENAFNSIPTPVIDTAMSSTSTNAVQNKVVNTALSGKSNSNHTHGSITNAGAITSGTALASGDAIVFADSSDSNKLKKSSTTFDGSTTTQFLSKKGTWVTPPNSGVFRGFKADTRLVNLSKTVTSTPANNYIEWTTTEDCIVWTDGYTGYGEMTIDDIAIFANATGTFTVQQPLPLVKGTKVKINTTQTNTTLTLKLKAYAVEKGSTT